MISELNIQVIYLSNLSWSDPGSSKHFAALVAGIHAHPVGYAFGGN